MRLTLRRPTRASAFIAVAAFVLIAASPGFAADSEAPAPGDAAPQFAPGTCPFSAAAVQPYRVECGHVTVRESRNRPDSRTLKLLVAIVHTQAKPAAADPAVLLEGGPGGNSVDLIPRRLHGITTPELLKSRDVIFWDQRGTGHSEPSLCEPLDAALLTVEYSGFSEADRQSRRVSALRACRQTLDAAHVDLSAINSATSAQDLSDIRRALHIESWNLWGVSYGTRLALEAMRSAPEGIRSVILDSVYPPNLIGSKASAPGLGGSLRRLFDQCRASEACSARFPNLEERVYHSLADFQRSPMVVPVASGAKFPVDHITVDGSLLAAGLYQAFYDGTLLPYMPALIELIDERNAPAIEALAQGLALDVGRLRQAMNYAVECYERSNTNSAAELRTADDSVPQLAPYFQDDLRFPELCDAFQDARAPDSSDAAVESAIPALIFAGEFDPVTPSDWGVVTQQSLTAGQLVLLRAHGHGEGALTPCGRALLTAFLTNPADPVNTFCASSLPKVRFVTDARAAPGLTLALVGVQTGSHRVYLAWIAVTIIALVVTFLWWLFLRLRGREPRDAPRAPRVIRDVSALTAFVAIAFFSVLGATVASLVESNPNILLIGIPGHEAWIFWLARIAVLFTVVLVAMTAKRWRFVKDSPMTWVAVGACVSFSLLVLRIGF
jgi:pimeloyl-ACP methyl ester carboxylesterase